MVIEMKNAFDNSSGRLKLAEKNKSMNEKKWPKLIHDNLKKKQWIKHLRTVDNLRMRKLRGYITAFVILSLMLFLPLCRSKFMT